MYDIIVEAVKNTYGITRRFKVKAISDKGIVYMNEHWSASETLTAECAALWTKHMGKTGLVVDLRY